MSGRKRRRVAATPGGGGEAEARASSASPTVTKGKGKGKDKARATKASKSQVAPNHAVSRSQQSAAAAVAAVVNGIRVDERPKLDIDQIPVCRIVGIKTVLTALLDPDVPGGFLFGGHGDIPLKRVRLMAKVDKTEDNGLWLNDGTGLVRAFNTTPPFGPDPEVGQLVELLGEIDPDRSVRCIACTVHPDPDVVANRRLQIVELEKTFYSRRYVAVDCTAAMPRPAPDPALTTPTRQRQAGGNNQTLNQQDAAELEDIMALAQDGMFAFSPSQGSQDPSQSQASPPQPSASDPIKRKIEDLLQLGSADGTDFATLVAECGGGDEAAVQRTLDRLAADGAIYTIGTKYHPM